MSDSDTESYEEEIICPLCLTAVPTNPPHSRNEFAVTPPGADLRQSRSDVPFRPTGAAAPFRAPRSQPVASTAFNAAGVFGPPFLRSSFSYCEQSPRTQSS